MHPLRLTLLASLVLLATPGCYEDIYDNQPTPAPVDDDDDDGAPDDDDDAVDDDDTTAATDADGDGSPEGEDCDDTDPANFPGNPEVCDGADNNCDGAVDEGVTISVFADTDGDGWGVESVSGSVCPGTPGWAEQAGDCNDSHPGIHPAATEVCNALDDDCDGVADSSAVCPCPVEYWPDDHHPYMFCATASTWPDAAADCAASDYRLVTFDSQDELDWSTATAITHASSENWWIGFSDDLVEGSWGWEDGSPPDFVNWCGGEPNNSHGGECVGESAENCAMLNWGEGGCWNDYPCSCFTIYRICEGVSELRPEG